MLYGKPFLHPCSRPADSILPRKARIVSVTGTSMSQWASMRTAGPIQLRGQSLLKQYVNIPMVLSSFTDSE